MSNMIGCPYCESLDDVEEIDSYYDEDEDVDISLYECANCGERWEEC